MPNGMKRKSTTESSCEWRGGGRREAPQSVAPPVMGQVAKAAFEAVEE